MSLPPIPVSLCVAPIIISNNIETAFHDLRVFFSIRQPGKKELLASNGTPIILQQPQIFANMTEIQQYKDAKSPKYCQQLYPASSLMKPTLRK